MNRFCFLMMLLSLAGIVNTAPAQGIKKFITVKVVDAATQMPIENATVVLQERSTSSTKNTDESGRAYFEWYLTTDEAQISLRVKDNAFFAHSPLTSTFIVTRQQDTYLITAPLKSGEIRFNVNAVDAKSNLPVANATVQVMLAGVKGNTGVTNSSGNVVLDFSPPGKLRELVLKATCDGYMPTELLVVIDAKSSYYPVVVTLEPKEQSKFLNVMIRDEHSNPVGDAVITATAFPDIYTGTTNNGGMARIQFTKQGHFNLSIRHDNFETVQLSTYLAWEPDQTDYAMDFQLKRKKSVLRNLMVIVREQETGKAIEKASVEAEGASGLTNSNGEAYLKSVVTLGQNAVVTIKAHGYEEKTMTYIGGGEDYRYAPPTEDKVYVRLRKEKKELKLVVIVLDKSADVPISNASVSVTNKDGKYLMKNKRTNAKGEADMLLTSQEWGNTPFRVMATATGYNEHWSSLTADLMNTENNPMYFTIYLEQAKATTGEKKYGPFDVDVLHWVPTGVSIKKGQQFRVTYDTTSKISFVREGTGETVYMYPDGFGVWGFFVLAAKVGDEIIHVGRAGGGSFQKDGVIELGAPRGTTFVPGDGKGTTGAWKISIYVKQ